MQSMANINNNQQSFISPIQIYQGVENNNEDFSSNPIDYSGLNQFADQVLSSNLDSNGDNVEGIHEESLKDQIEVRFENNVIKVDLHEIDFENYTEEDGTPTILEEKKSSEYYYLESILYSYMTDLQQRAQEYREKYNMPLMLDGRMKLAESDYKEIILLAKKFQFSL